MDIYIQYFTEDEIIDSFRTHVASARLTKEKYLLIKYELQKRFENRKDDFQFWGKRTYYKKNENGDMVLYKEEKIEIHEKSMR